MSTTKALNYRDFLDLCGRICSNPLTTRRVETTGGTEKLAGVALKGNVSVNGGSPTTFVIHNSGSSGRAKFGEDVRVGVIARIGRSFDLRRVYSGRGCAIVRPLENAADFELLRKKVRGFAELPVGWDSYDGTAPSSKAIGAALAVVHELECAELLPEWVVPTSDSSILISAKKRGTLLKWEIDSDGDVAVMLKPKFSQATYHDLEPSEIGIFLQQSLR